MRSRRLLLVQFLGLLAACSQENTKSIRKPNNLESSSLPLKYISVPPQSGKFPEALVVALHGWGANAEDLTSLTPMLRLPNYQFIFPEAPFPHPSVPGGREWYDLQEPGAKGLTESRQILQEFLNGISATAGVSPTQTFVLGFSQGGAMTLDVGLDLPVAGLVSLSGYLHPIKQMPVNSAPPTLIVHGTKDYVVDLSAARQARDALTKMGVKVKYFECENMGHEIRPSVLEKVRQFFIENLSD